MSFIKFIKSGINFELYEYERPTSNRGRPKGYKVAFNREDLVDGGGVALQQAQQKRKDNAKRASMAFRRLVQSNLETGGNPLFCSFTFKENRSDVRECARFFHLFTVRMRRIFGSEFKYIAVPEFQKRGAVHYHALFWGLPQDIFQQERKVRRIARIWGEGFVDVMETDGHLKLAGYMAKYMTKAMCDSRLFYHKAYFTSRNVLRPLQVSGIPLWWVQDEYDLSTAQLVLQKDFMTYWMGKGRYTNYLLK